MIEDWQNGGFGIYVHWPFCEAKCPYCDFNSHVVRSIDQERWARAYLKEIDRAALNLRGRVVRSIFFGGGTPSLMNPKTVELIIDRISHHWVLANDVEITLEANPSSVEAEKFLAFRSAGVNRVSLGVQALNDNDLKTLGRLHNTQEAFRALDIAQSCFERASFDLIYARQNQSLKDWEIELKQALTLGFSHFSLYQLTIEGGTAFGDRYKAGKLKGLPTDDVSADMYELTLDICETAGLPYYEVSNFAKPEQESRHNLIYWRYGDYLGLGPGAHGRLTLPDGSKIATETWLNPQVWLRAAEETSGEQSRIPLTLYEQGQEFLVMNLRLREGLSLHRFETLSGSTISNEGLQALVKQGVIHLDDGIIQIDRNYVNVTNSIIAELAPD
ncbi:MAG: radical SAM family heme chaperone HemW [Aliishimia sp.]